MNKHTKLPISLVMVIHNEEKLLERAIESCIDLVDDIVIVHDGDCRDNSLTIARKYTKKVFVLPSARVAEPHRPFTYEKARNEWILQLDADEYLSQSIRKNLKRFITQDIDVYAFAWPAYHKGRSYIQGHKTALFKKSKIYLLGNVHEYPKPIDKSVRVAKVENILMHEPSYDNLSISIFSEKWIPRAKLHASLLRKDFSKISKWNYTKVEWDYPTNLRMKHPFLLGMVVTPLLFPLLYSLRNVWKYKSFFYFRIGLLKSVYFFMVYYYYFQLRKE